MKTGLNRPSDGVWEQVFCQGRRCDGKKRMWLGGSFCLRGWAFRDAFAVVFKGFKGFRGFRGLGFRGWQTAGLDRP